MHISVVPRCTETCLSLVCFYLTCCINTTKAEESALHTHHCKIIHLKFTSRQYCTWKPKTCWCTLWSQAKQNKHNKISNSFFFFFFFSNKPSNKPLANNWPFVLYKEECEHKCDGNILSWIKNFTLDCTRYYDKLFTYSDINFFKSSNRHYVVHFL